MWVRALDLVKELNTKGRMAVQAAFSEATAQAGVAASWRQGEDMPAECVVRHARHSDVLILARRMPATWKPPPATTSLSRCCYPPGVPSSCCRRRGPSATRARGCCTAGTRAASRPARSPTRRSLLRGASALRALTLGHGAPADPDLRASFEDLAAYCASHGFPQLESEFRDAREAGIGDAIPSAAADFGADLIVMGHTDTAARANGSWEAPRARCWRR